MDEIVNRNKSRYGRRVKGKNQSVKAHTQSYHVGRAKRVSPQRGTIDKNEMKTLDMVKDGKLADNTPIEAVKGVGYSTAQALREEGIYTVGDLRKVVKESKVKIDPKIRKSFEGIEKRLTENRDESKDTMEFVQSVLDESIVFRNKQEFIDEASKHNAYSLVHEAQEGRWGRGGLFQANVHRSASRNIDRYNVGFKGSQEELDKFIGLNKPMEMKRIQLIFKKVESLNEKQVESYKEMQGYKSKDWSKIYKHLREKTTDENLDNAVKRKLPAYYYEKMKKSGKILPESYPYDLKDRLKYEMPRLSTEGDLEEFIGNFKSHRTGHIDNLVEWVKKRNKSIKKNKKYSTTNLNNAMGIELASGNRMFKLPSGKILKITRTGSTSINELTTWDNAIKKEKIVKSYDKNKIRQKDINVFNYAQSIGLTESPEDFLDDIQRLEKGEETQILPEGSNRVIMDTSRHVGFVPDVNEVSKSMTLTPVPRDHVKKLDGSYIIGESLYTAEFYDSFKNLAEFDMYSAGKDRPLVLRYPNTKNAILIAPMQPDHESKEIVDKQIAEWKKRG